MGTPINAERISLTARQVIGIAAHVILATVYISKLTSRLDRLSEITTEIKTQQDKDAQEAKIRLQTIETEIASLKVRIAIVENQLQQNGKNEK